MTMAPSQAMLKQVLHSWYEDRGLDLLPPVKNAPAQTHTEDHESSAATPCLKHLQLWIAPRPSGHAATLLEKMIAATNIPPSMIQICHLDEVSPSFDIDRSEESSIVLIMGQRALDIVTAHAQVKVETMRGNWFAPKSHREAAAIATWHPNDLIENPSLKKEAWVDLQLIMAKFGKPSAR